MEWLPMMWNSPWDYKMKTQYTEKARKDLLGIKEYISREFGQEELAVKILKEITGTIRNLEQLPYIGVRISKMTGRITCRYCSAEKKSNRYEL